MKKKPTTTSRKTTKTSSKSKNLFQSTSIDLMSAVLIVSLLINIFVVCMWVALRTTAEYDVALTQFFFGR